MLDSLPVKFSPESRMPLQPPPPPPGSKFWQCGPYTKYGSNKSKIKFYFYKLRSIKCTGFWLLQKSKLGVTFCEPCTIKCLTVKPKANTVLTEQITSAGTGASQSYNYLLGCLPQDYRINPACLDISLAPLDKEVPE